MSGTRHLYYDTVDHAAAGCLHELDEHIYIGSTGLGTALFRCDAHGCRCSTTYGVLMADLLERARRRIDDPLSWQDPRD